MFHPLYSSTVYGGRERVSGAVLNFESLLVGAAVLGIVLSLATVAVFARNMSGTPDWELSVIYAQSIRILLSLNALKTTDAELTLMAMAATIGDRRCPVSG